ncbi:MAG: 30S ribosomal protein S19 [Candidatus Micrarchaeota archaeon]
MARKFVYRGINVEELQKLPLDEFIKMLPATQRRTMKRSNKHIKVFLAKFRDHQKKHKDKPVKTHFRDMIVFPEMLGARIQIYAGKDWADITITPEMLGHRLGEYSHTTKMVKHSGPGIGATRGSKSVELK